MPKTTFLAFQSECTLHPNPGRSNVPLACHKPAAGSRAIVVGTSERSLTPTGMPQLRPQLAREAASRVSV